MSKSFELHLLLPSDHLPGEGFNSGAFAGAQRETELIGWYIQQLHAPVVAFAVSPSGITVSEPSIELRHARLVWQKDEADAPWIDPSGVAVEVPIIEALAQDELTPRYVGEERKTDDVLRELLANMRSLLEPSLCGFRGKPLPLLEWVPGEEPGTGHAIFHGVWMVDEEALSELRRADAEADLGLILEESDVEGRGLKELLAAALMLGFVFGNQTAGAAEKAPAPASSQTAQRGGLGAALKNLFSRDDAPSTNGSSAKQAKASKKAKAKSQYNGQAAPTMDEELLKTAAPGNVKVVVEISKQRAYVLVDGKIALDTPISSASSRCWTPRGTFTITQRVRTGKMSTIYKCPLPYWMRLGESAVGMHIGDLPGYPASHGCIRLPKDIAPVIFDHTFSGTQVQVVDTWTPPAPAAPAAEMIAQK